MDNDNNETAKNVQKNENRKRAIRAADAVPPLDDKAFKKFLDNEEWFRAVAEWILEELLPDGELKRIGEEYFLFTNTKAIRMDNFRETSEGVVNMEGQIDAKKFIFKRHLYYWAMAYISPFQAGQPYEKFALRICSRIF